MSIENINEECEDDEEVVMYENKTMFPMNQLNKTEANQGLEEQIISKFIPFT